MARVGAGGGFRVSAAADRAENVGSFAGVSASAADTDDLENVGSFAWVSVSLADSDTAASGLPVTAKSRKAPPSRYSTTAGTGNSGAAELTEAAGGSAHRVTAARAKYCRLAEPSARTTTRQERYPGAKAFASGAGSSMRSADGSATAFGQVRSS